MINLRERRCPEYYRTLPSYEGIQREVSFKRLSKKSESVSSPALQERNLVLWKREGRTMRHQAKSQFCSNVRCAGNSDRGPRIVSGT